MKKILFFLALFVSFVSFGQNDTTKYFKYNDYGQNFRRIKAREAFIPPSDTTINKLGMAAIGNSLFFGNGTSWTAFGGGAVSSVFGRTGAVTAQVGDYSSFYYPLTGNPSGFLTAADISGKLNISDTAVMLNPYVRGSGVDGRVAFWTGGKTLSSSSAFYVTANANGAFVGVSSITASTNAQPAGYFQNLNGADASIGIIEINQNSAGTGGNILRLLRQGVQQTFFNSLGVPTFSNLSGTGNRIVQLDASGLISRGSIDPATIATTSQLGNYLPLTGGTLTGPLSGTSAGFSGAVNANSFDVANGNYFKAQRSSGGIYINTLGYLSGTNDLLLSFSDALRIRSTAVTDLIVVSSAGATNFTATTPSSSTTTGALTVAGGVGIAGALNVGGGATITGNSSIAGSLAAGVGRFQANSVIPTGAIADYTLTASAGLNGLYMGVATSGTTWMQSGREDNTTTYPLSINPTGGNVLIGTSVDNGNKLQVSGAATFSSSVTANSFVKSGGTSSQFLMADGSVTTNSATTHGTYTPTLTNSGNISSSTAYVTSYTQVGNVVTVSGQVFIDPTTTGNISMAMSLPIAPTFTSAAQVGGTFSNEFGNAGGITYSGSGSTVQFLTNATNASGLFYYFTFSYRLTN